MDYNGMQQQQLQQHEQQQQQQELGGQNGGYQAGYPSMEAPSPQAYSPEQNGGIDLCFGTKNECFQASICGLFVIYQ